MPDADNGSYSGVVIQEPEVIKEPMPQEEAYGPVAPDATGPDSSSGGAPAEEGAPALSGGSPANAAPFEPKLCLVLSPGMAKALAHAAVLEAIRKAGIPVHCVTGTEMGAVVGALYSKSGGSTNNLQWQLFKFHKENYFNFPLLSLREPKSSGKKLHEFLREIFGSSSIEGLSIRFATLATDPTSGSAIAQTQGDLVDALSATLALPGIFDSWRSGGEERVSGAITSPAPIELARSLGGNFIVLVDVVEDAVGAPKENARFQKAFAPVRNLIRLQKKEASFVIQVKAGRFAFDDFSRQGEILSAGATAAEQMVPQLKAAWEQWSAGQR